MKTPSVLLAGVPLQSEMKLRAAIPEVEWRTMAAGARDAVKEGMGAAAVVHLGLDVEAGFKLLRDLSAAGMRVVLVGPSKDADLILRALREGAKEFVLAGEDETLVRAVREQVRPSTEESGGTVYATFAAKGGVGATTVSVNLAGVLQRSGKRTALVDLNLNMGDVLAFLDLPGGYSLTDVIANMRRLDRGLLDTTMLKHGSGVHILSQSHRIEDADRIEPTGITGLVNFLRQNYDAVVLDGLRSFDDHSIAALDAADSILLVLTQEVPAVRDAKRCADLFNRLGHQDKLRLIVNRFQKQPDITLEVIRDTVGLPVSATIANDYPSVIRAINRGVMLVDDAPKTPVARDMQALVAAAGAEQSAGDGEKKSLFKRLFTGKVSHAT